MQDNVAPPIISMLIFGSGAIQSREDQDRVQCRTENRFFDLLRKDADRIGRMDRIEAPADR